MRNTPETQANMVNRNREALIAAAEDSGISLREMVLGIKDPIALACIAEVIVNRAREDINKTDYIRARAQNVCDEMFELDGNG